MKRKSPISIDRIQFYTYNCDESDELVFIDQFPYDNRHDFFVDGSLAGIAIKAEVVNIRFERGARRDVSFTVVDMTERCETAVQRIKICIAKDGIKDVHVHFPAETSGIVGDHTYKLVVRDETADEPLAESMIHLLGKSTMG